MNKKFIILLGNYFLSVIILYKIIDRYDTLLNFKRKSFQQISEILNFLVDNVTLVCLPIVHPQGRIIVEHCLMCLPFSDTSRHKCRSIFITYLIPKKTE